MKYLILAVLAMPLLLTGCADRSHLGGNESCPEGQQAAAAHRKMHALSGLRAHGHPLPCGDHHHDHDGAGAAADAKTPAG